MPRKKIEKNLAYDDQKRLYYVYFDYGVDWTGKRCRKTRTFSNLKDAKVALLSFEVDKLQGNVIQPNSITVDRWLNYWLEGVIKPNREYTTYYCYQCIIKNHVSPGLGDTLLQKLTPYKIQQYYANIIQEKGLSTNTVHKHHILLHTSLKMAYQQGVISENPLDKVEPPRTISPHQVYYTPSQLRKLFQVAEGTWLEVVIKLGGYLGLRRGEICGLRWENINMDEKMLHIKLTRTTAGSATVEKEPKTDHSTRTLGIDGLDDLIQILQKTRLDQVERKKLMGDHYSDSGYVLVKSDGKPRDPNQVTRELKKFVLKNKLPPITVHGLRHTFASVANRAHIPLLDIGKALGHKDVSITGRIYTHLFDYTHKEVLNAVVTQIATGLE